MWLILPLFLLLLRFSSPAQHHAVIIEALRNQSNMGRVYLVYNDMLKNAAVQLSKILATKNIASGLLRASDFVVETMYELPSPSFFVLLIADNTTRGFILKISHHRQLMSTNAWLLLGDFDASDDHKGLNEFFKGILLPLDCEFFVTEETDGEAVLVTAISHFENKSLRIRHFGTFHHNHTQWVSNTLYEDSRTNLEGMKVKTAYSEGFLFSLTPPKGYFGTMWEILENALNFTSDYILVNDADSALEEENQSWTGILGVLQRNEAWATASQVEMSSHRAEVVTFLDPLLVARKHVFIRMQKKKRERDHWNYVSKPFTLPLWITIGVTLLVFAIALFGTGKVVSEPRRYNISDSLLVALASFCSQGVEETPRYWSTRLVFLTAFLTGYVLLAGYSAAVISDLATVTPTLPFVDFKGMLKHGKYRLGMTVSSPILDELKTTEDPIMTRVVHELVPPPSQLPHTETEGLELVCKKKHYAFLADEMDWKMGLHNLSCEVMPVPNAYVPVSLSMALTKNIDLRNLFNYRYRRIVESGIMRLVYQRTMPKDPVLAKTHDITVTLREVRPAMYMLLFGIGTAIILLVLEILSAKGNPQTAYPNTKRIKIYPTRNYHKKVFSFNPYGVKGQSF